MTKMITEDNGIASLVLDLPWVQLATPKCRVLACILDDRVDLEGHCAVGL